MQDSVDNISELFQSGLHIAELLNLETAPSLEVKISTYKLIMDYIAIWTRDYKTGHHMLDTFTGERANFFNKARSILMIKNCFYNHYAMLPDPKGPGQLLYSATLFRYKMDTEDAETEALYFARLIATNLEHVKFADITHEKLIEQSLGVSKDLNKLDVILKRLLEFMRADTTLISRIRIIDVMHALFTHASTIEKAAILTAIDRQTREYSRFSRGYAIQALTTLTGLRLLEKRLNPDKPGIVRDGGKSLQSIDLFNLMSRREWSVCQVEQLRNALESAEDLEKLLALACAFTITFNGRTKLSSEMKKALVSLVETAYQDEPLSAAVACILLEKIDLTVKRSLHKHAAQHNAFFSNFEQLFHERFSAEQMKHIFNINEEAQKIGLETNRVVLMEGLILLQRWPLI